MKITKAFDVLDLARRARENNDIFNVLLISPPGLGKTEGVVQWAESRGLNHVTISLSTIDPPDFKGFPIVQTVNGRQRLSFAAPDFWPDEGQGVIILEELNRASTSIMQCVYSLADARRGFDGYKLPKGWIIVGCINPDSSIYDTNEMDPALKDRFEMFHITYDKPSFVDYINTNKWNKDLVNFIESGIWQYKAPEDIGNVPGTKYISPRTLSKLNASLKAGVAADDELEIYNAILGSNLGKDFYNFKHNDSPVMVHDLKTQLKHSLQKLERFSDPNNYKNGMISLTVKDIVQDKDISDELLAKVLGVIPVEQCVVLLQQLEFVRKDETILTRMTSKFPEIKSKLKTVLTYGKK